MTGYKCDRCGQWHVGYPAGYLADNHEESCSLIDKTYDLCPDCFRSIVSYAKNSAITSD